MYEVFLCLTGDCNLHCGYCYEKNKRNSHTHPLSECDYSIENVLGLLDNLSKYKDSIYVYFYGGEPTLKPELLHTLSSKIKDEHPSVYQILHTNGLLLDTLPDELFNNIELIFLSVNMESKIAYNSRDFYIATVRSNLKWVRDLSNIPILVRLTYTKDSKFLETCFLFEDIADAITWQIVNMPEANMKETLENYRLDMSLLLTKWFDQLHEHTRAHAQYIPLDYAFLVMLDPTSFRYEVAPCGFGQSLLFVDLDGSIYACAEMMQYHLTKVGHIKKGFNLTEMETISTQVLEKCSDCIAKMYCRGRCPGMHLKSAINTQEQICSATKSFFKDFIEHMEKLDDLTKKQYLAHVRGPQMRHLMYFTECVP